MKQPPASPADDRSAHGALRPKQETAETLWIRAAVTQYEGALIQYAARLLGGDYDRARDVVQDTFVRLWTADRSSVNGHLGQWLYRVCRNRALDVRRKEVRMTHLRAEQPEPPGNERVGMPEDQRVLQESSTTVLGMLDSLPEQQQEAVRLKFQGGLSYREISNVMEITVNHVGVLIHNGVKAIREKLAAASQAQVRAASVSAAASSGSRRAPGAK